MIEGLVVAAMLWPELPWWQDWLYSLAILAAIVGIPVFCVAFDVSEAVADPGRQPGVYPRRGQVPGRAYGQGGPNGTPGVPPPDMSAPMFGLTEAQFRRCEAEDREREARWAAQARMAAQVLAPPAPTPGQQNPLPPAGQPGGRGGEPITDGTAG